MHRVEGEPETALAMFRASVTRIPDAIAIHYFDRAITFRELDSASDALADALQRRGFARGGRLALFLQNDPQFVIGLLAGWKAGGTAVPINPMNREREVAILLRDSGATALLALESLWHVARGALEDSAVETRITTSELDLLAGSHPTALAGAVRERPADSLDLIELLDAHAGTRPAPTRLRPDEPAALAYTSGTTGPPKGAMVTHRNLVFNCGVYRQWGDLDERDVALAMAPLFHITGLVAHVGVSLLTGMPLVLFHRFDPGAALELVEQHRVTFTIGPITAFLALARSPTLADADLSSLTKVLSGGAPIHAATLELTERALETPIHNVYGLTETTSPSHMVPRGLRAPVDGETGALAVGLPVPGTSARVVQASGDDAVPGAVGEILIRGPQVIPGYWAQPEASRAAIVDGWLHTGDVGKVDDEGWFYVVDRSKDQINASGFKVWPREVEEVICAYRGVREAAVVGVPDDYRGETVKAFVVLEDGEMPDPDALIEFCRERLAAYKYPRQVEYVAELPKTASGKVMRRVLRTDAAEGLDR